MKTRLVIFCIVLTALFVTGCSSVVQFSNTGTTVHASDVITTSTREVSGFSGIDMRTFGSVVLSQGETESLTIKGSDNIVPLVKTSVRNGTLVIEMDENVDLSSLNSANTLTFTIGVKDLNSLTVSGLGDVHMDNLTTPSLAVTMSGAGQVQLNQLTADSLNINVSGLGNVEIAGKTTQASIDISGAGNVKAPDLTIKTATVNIPGLGGATVWVTDQLNGTISGAGSVSYYGSPKTDVNATGLGSFKSLGSK